jgi:hypothetical protein
MLSASKVTKKLIQERVRRVSPRGEVLIQPINMIKR